MRVPKTLFLFLMLFGLVLTGCASINDVEDYSGKMHPGNGILVVSVDTMIPFSDLRLIRPDDTFAAIAARNLPLGRSLRFVELPAGDYSWARVELGNDGYYEHYIALDKSKKERYTFTVKPGVVNYPGDFVVQLDEGDLLKLIPANIAGYQIFDYLSGFYIQLIDRNAMLLQDLKPEQKGMIAKLGMVYVGPGMDSFSDYYKSIAGNQVALHD